jgi:hypothetical protein
VDDWLVHLRDESFVALLPLLCRAFSGFTAPERRQLGQRARQPGGVGRLTQPGGGEFDHARAETGLRTVLMLLGVTAEDQGRR